MRYALSMHIPKQKKAFFMPMFSHEGERSLDAIATRFYGREYVGQQTGDMLPNDSHVVYKMNRENVKQLMYNLEEEREYNGIDSLAKWLSAPATEDRREKLDILRAAPEPDYILADLITKGELPYGTYVLSVWW